MRSFPKVEDVQGAHSSFFALDELDHCPACERCGEDYKVEYQVGLHLLADD